MGRIQINNVKKLTGRIHTQYIPKELGPYTMYIQYLGGGSHIACGVRDLQGYIDAVIRNASSTIGKENQPISVYKLFKKSDEVVPVDVSESIKPKADLENIFAEHKWGLKLF